MAILVGSATGQEYADMGNPARENRKQPLQGFSVEKLHAPGTQPAFFDRP
jgi:hypothetical protein